MTDRTAGYRQDGDAELAAGLLDIADIVSVDQLTASKYHCQCTQRVERRHGVGRTCPS